MGLTQEIANYVAKTRYRDIPLEVIHLAQGLILDGLGVALAGQTEEGTKIILNHTRRMGGREEVSVFGTAYKLPASQAALVNGVAAHAMDYDGQTVSIRFTVASGAGSDSRPGESA